MTTYKIANKDARYYVERQLYFKGSNLFSEERNGNYVVFSYGYHWPLVMFHRELATWFVNTSKRSVSTSKQLSQARPNVGINREGFKVNKFDDMLIVPSTIEEMTRLMNQ